jgi:uncharacterized membrane protein YeaQ/YmgE (transglycosylase-associated protein family)
MEILGLIIAGAIIGALGRLAAPGRQPIPIWLTVIVGIVGVILGYYASAAFGVAATRGIDWLRWIISIIIAAALVALAANFYTRRARV